MCCPTRCAGYCAPCQPLLRAFSGWIQSSPLTEPLDSFGQTFSCTGCGTACHHYHGIPSLVKSIPPPVKSVLSHSASNKISLLQTYSCTGCGTASRRAKCTASWLSRLTPKWPSPHLFDGQILVPYSNLKEWTLTSKTHASRHIRAPDAEQRPAGRDAPPHGFLAQPQRGPPTFPSRVDLQPLGLHTNRCTHEGRFRAMHRLMAFSCNPIEVQSLLIFPSRYTVIAFHTKSLIRSREMHRLMAVSRNPKEVQRPPTFPSHDIIMAFLTKVVFGF